MLIWSRDLTTVTKKNSSHELSDKWSPINASSSLKKFSLLEKVENFFTTLAAKQRFHHNRCKNKSSSENTRIFLPQFYTEAMRSSQVLTHARTRSCSTHHLRVWEHVQVKESQQREQQQRWPGYSFRHQEKMWRIGPNQRDSWSSFGKAKTATTIQEISSTHAIITIFSHRTWAWDLTRHPDVRFGNIWSEKMERFDSGNSQATMKELSDVSEM